MPVLRNLTPHTVRISVAPGSPVLELPPGGTPPRCQILRRNVGNVMVHGIDVPLAETVVADGVADLPEEEEGVILIVSRLVAEAVPERRDLFFPDQCLRSADGTVTACRSLARVPAPWARQ